MLGGVKSCSQTLPRLVSCGQTLPAAVGRVWPHETTPRAHFAGKEKRGDPISRPSPPLTGKGEEVSFPDPPLASHVIKFLQLLAAIGSVLIYNHVRETSARRG